MYIKNDVCYAGSLQPKIKISNAKPLPSGMILITFSTGEKRLFDTTQLKSSAFASLSDEEIFSQPTIFHGVLTWDNGNIAIAPETMYQKSYPYTVKDLQ